LKRFCGRAAAPVAAVHNSRGIYARLYIYFLSGAEIKGISGQLSTYHRRVIWYVMITIIMLPPAVSTSNKNKFASVLSRRWPHPHSFTFYGFLGAEEMDSYFRFAAVFTNCDVLFHISADGITMS